jgi:hypothetical protein
VDKGRDGKQRRPIVQNGKAFDTDWSVSETTEEQRRVSGEDERPVYLAMTPRQETRLGVRTTLTALGCKFGLANLKSPPRLCNSNIIQI